VPPAVVDAINAHRAALLAREQAAMQAQAQAWLGVEQALQTQVDALALELAQNPGAATMGQLQRSRRYQALLQQTRAELRNYEGYIEQRIEAGQQDMVTLALQHSQQAVNAVATEAQIVASFDRLPVSAVNNMVGLAGDGSPLRAVLADATRGAPDALARELVNGIALGRNPIAVARTAMRLGLGQSFTRMQTIARTEQLRVYRETTLAAYANSRVVSGYQRLSARDTRVCPACLFADGRVYRVADGFDEHPNGRCALVPVLGNVPLTQFETGQQWFRRQTPTVQQQMLGPGRYQAWQRGDATLDDLVSRDYNDTWGGSLRPTRVSELPRR